jgi:hypothetical protein
MKSINTYQDKAFKQAILVGLSGKHAMVWSNMAIGTHSGRCIASKSNTCSALARLNLSNSFLADGLQAIGVHALRWQGQVLSSVFLTDALQAIQVHALRWQV